jgi:hypothetical protein
MTKEGAVLMLFGMIEDRLCITEVANAFNIYVLGGLRSPGLGNWGNQYQYC